MTQPIDSKKANLNNSTSTVTPTTSKINKIFTTTINKFVDVFKFTNRTIRSIGTLIYTKTSALINHLSILVFGGDIIQHRQLMILEIKKELGNVEPWDEHRKIALTELQDDVNTCKHNESLVSIIDKKILSYKDTSELTKDKKSALCRLQKRLLKINLATIKVGSNKISLVMTP